MIAILVPVLGRAQAIRPLVQSVKESTSTDWMLIFLCSPGDDLATWTCRSFTDDPAIAAWKVDWPPEIGGDWARKINYAYTETTPGVEYYLLGATDLRFHPGWDTEVLRVAEETGAGVIGTNDLGNATVMRGLHSTHPVVRRKYADEQGVIDEPGKILHEGYHHQWVDTELVETAKMRRQWAFAKQSHVEHLHPFWKKSEMDATYEKALSTTSEDHQLFQKRRLLWSRAAMKARARMEVT